MKRYLLAAVLIFLAFSMALYILANHSTSERDLVCSGRWFDSDGLAIYSPENAYVHFEEYRPWVFWSEGEGNVTIQTDDIVPQVYFPRLTKIGNGVLTTYDIGDEKGSKGMYREANSEITFSYGESLTFRGTCSLR